MKKITRLLFVLLASILSLTGCGEAVQAKGFELKHFDGSDLSSGYDTDLLYKNNTDFWGGDSGVIWVSKEQSEEYGGYFYQYMSGCAGVSSAAAVFTDEETGEQYHANVAISRSPDLNDWEICGTVAGGFGLKTTLTEWVDDYVWAPETIYAECDCEGECDVHWHNKYFMYFSAGTPINDGSIPGATYLNSSSWRDRLNLGIAVSDTPVGPFELVCSKNVYGDELARNLNGEVVTTINPSISIRQVFGLDYEFSAIDMHPFMDDNGDFYLYFVKHITDEFTALTNPDNRQSALGNQIWGVKMKDMISPDYDTLTKVVINGNWTSVTYVGDKNVTYRKDENGKFYDFYEHYSEKTVKYDGEDMGDGVYKIVINYKTPVTQYIKTTDGTNYLAYSDVACTDALIGYLGGSRVYDYNYQVSNLWSDGTPNLIYGDEEGGDGGVVEGPQMITTKDKDGRTVYLLTYSPYGVGSPSYDVRFAYSYNPLTGFMKPKPEEGRSILDWDKNVNDFMTHLGHVQFLNVDDEWWIVHWEGPNPISTNVNIGRIYGLSSMTWTDMPTLDFPVPVANGPSKTLQPLPSVFTGYRNVASKAKVTATNDEGDTVKFLNDGLVVTNWCYEDRCFKANKETTITLEFDEPTVVRGILVYNGYDADYEFEKVGLINFTLAESPSWLDGDARECYIADLALGKYNGNTYPGSAALATFNEIKVSKIQIRIPVAEGKSGVSVSDIYVMGK